MDCIAIHDVQGIAQYLLQKNRFGTGICNAIHIRSRPAGDGVRSTPVHAALLERLRAGVLLRRSANHRRVAFHQANVIYRHRGGP
jgi:hypothetical protein